MAMQCFERYEEECVCLDCMRGFDLEHPELWTINAENNLKNTARRIGSLVAGGVLLLPGIHYAGSTAHDAVQKFAQEVSCWQRSVAITMMSKDVDRETVC